MKLTIKTLKQLNVERSNNQNLNLHKWLEGPIILLLGSNQGLCVLHLIIRFGINLTF